MLKNVYQYLAFSKKLFLVRLLYSKLFLIKVCERLHGNISEMVAAVDVAQKTKLSRIAGQNRKKNQLFSSGVMHEKVQVYSQYGNFANFLGTRYFRCSDVLILICSTLSN